MEQRLRNTCPCLGSLWSRIFDSDKNREDPAHGRPAVDPGPEKTRDSDMFRAVWRFQARHPEELTVDEGDLLCVLVQEGGWWTARKMDGNGKVLGTGLVPGSYLEREETLEMKPWFFGTMNRFEAQSHLLGSENEDGAFLVRHSDKDNIGLVLSVRTTSQVKHFKIIQTDDRFQVNQNQRFDSLMDLVQHYSKNDLSNISRLRRPCRRKKSHRDDEGFSDERWDLPKDEFTVGEKLGSGFFADVYRGRWKEHINVAIKIIKNDSDVNQEFQREVQMLKDLRHRHLISLFAVCTESPPFFIVMELMEKGSLLHFLRSPEGQQQDIMSIIDMGAQVADGMSYLEEKNSIHRDLAARNVLVGEDLICKVADFGLARVIKEPVYVTEERKIPYKWSAPEAISHGRFSVKSDVWSFGILLYEIITYGGTPYPGFSNQETHQQVTSGYRMPPPPKCPKFLHQMMLKCWSEEPEDRLDFKRIKIDLDNSSEMELEGQSTYCAAGETQ